MQGPRSENFNTGAGTPFWRAPLATAKRCNLAPTVCRGTFHGQSSSKQVRPLSILPSGTSEYEDWVFQSHDAVTLPSIHVGEFCSCSLHLASRLYKHLNFMNEIIGENVCCIKCILHTTFWRCPRALLCRKRKAVGAGLGSQKKFKRENKNRPVERSSKKPVPRLREVIEVRNRSTSTLHVNI